MTVQEFLSVTSGFRLYNKAEGIYAQPSGPICIHKELQGLTPAELVAEKMDGNEHVDYICINLELEFHQDGRMIRGGTISMERDREKWQIIASLSDIDNQRLLNRILMYELEEVKKTIRMPIRIPLLDINLMHASHGIIKQSEVHAHIWRHGPSIHLE